MSRQDQVALRMAGLCLVALGGWIVASGRASSDEVTAAARPVAPTDEAPLKSLALSWGFEGDQPVTLRGSDARQQLVVTGTLADGEVRDLTRRVSYTIEPAGIASVDEAGFVRPLTDGQATITASAEDAHASLRVVVQDFAGQAPISFANQIVPVFTRHGCNSGGCHGKSGGQNGFKLSLLGFEPAEDYEHLVLEGRGRRVFPGAPDQSLLLLKPTNVVPHGGGQRFDQDSHEYRMLWRWIAQGMPPGKSSDPKLVGISVYPTERAMPRRSRQQLIVLARYSDESVEDVTRLAQFELNNGEMAEISATGLVSILDLAGNVGVMARYQGQVGVFRASVPLGLEVKDLPPPVNFVDELVFDKLRTLGIPPSPPCDDATFLRRATIDLAGRVPTPDEAAEFLADADKAKRDKLIDRLLDSGDYADYFANKWGAILRNRRKRNSFQHGTYAFHDWIRESLYTNKPYDQFVREILTASGEIGHTPPVAWYREVSTPEDEVENFSQLFLGLRMQCAKCHHHPFEKWSQRDYYGLSAFFTQVGRKDGHDPDEQRVYHKRGEATAVNPNTGERLKPTGLGGEPLSIPPEHDPRQALVDWTVAPDNPYFAPALVNRYWKHFFGVGIVDPEDDMRQTNPASNPQLLAALAEHFVAQGYDLKDLVRTICRSRTYQLGSEPVQGNADDKQNYSRFYPRRLPAEVLLDALDQAAGTRTRFKDLPPDMRAVQLPDSTADSYFLAVFGRPESTSACECERMNEATLPQSLHLLNSTEMQNKLADGNGRAARLAKDAERPVEEKVREVYRTVLSREPSAGELGVARDHLARAGDKEPEQRAAYEDLLWVLVNSKEFLLNH